MKKQYLTYAGIVSALILVGMFIIIVLNAFPYQFLSPTITIDPITDMNVDENNRIILTGTTSLPESSHDFHHDIGITRFPVAGKCNRKNSGKGHCRDIPCRWPEQPLEGDSRYFTIAARRLHGITDDNYLERKFHRIC